MDAENSQPQVFTNEPEPELKRLIDQQGVVFRIEPMKTYLAHKQFIGASKLHDIITLTPLQYLYKWLNPPPETDATIFGSAFHTYILESKEYARLYDIFDPANRPLKDKNFQSKENRVWRDEWMTACEMRGTIMLPKEDDDTIKEMEKSLQSNPTTRNILNQTGVRELSIYTKVIWNNWTFYVKIRPDFVSLIKPVYFDLKTTRDASPAKNKFPSDSFRFGYDIKVALYFDILFKHWEKLIEWCIATYITIPTQSTQKLKRALIIAIEDSAPFDIAVYNVPEETMEMGRYRYHAAMDRFQTCLKSQKWPGYEIYGPDEQGIFDLYLPKYAQEEIVI